jgi:hypothetical protein
VSREELTTGLTPFHEPSELSGPTISHFDHFSGIAAARGIRFLDRKMYLPH